MAWRLARALETLRAQVNEKWPNRSKESDGSIGNAEHSARESDHNPDSSGVVHAIDITHDPKSGFDSYAFADLILKKQDPRLRYVISNRRIGSGPAGSAPGIWRPYRVPPNKNPHDHHCHVSCMYDAGADDNRPWDIDGVSAPTAGAIAAYVQPPPTLRRGSQGEYVKLLQSKLGFTGDDIDGDFGPKTLTKLKDFQTSHQLVVDGIAGPQVWNTLG